MKKISFTYYRFPYLSDRKYGINNAWIPRIMVGARKGVAAARTIVVGKNPGHPIPEEAEKYCIAV